MIRRETPDDQIVSAVAAALSEEVTHGGEVLAPVVRLQSALLVVRGARLLQKIRRAVFAMSARPRGMSQSVVAGSPERS